MKPRLLSTAWVRSNHIGKQENPVEKPNCLRHTVWKAGFRNYGLCFDAMEFFFSVRSGDLDILYS